MKLRWRASRGARRSLGWIPFKGSAIRYRNGQLLIGKMTLSLWDSYGLAGYEIGSGNISEDSPGRWYINICVKLSEQHGPRRSEATKSVGIDLGLKNFASLSDAHVVGSGRHYRKLETELAKAQRARKKAGVHAIHAKIRNSRRDQLHKLSRALVEKYGAIFIGNVNASALAKTRMAKSVLDAGWSSFRTMLRYKCDYASVWFDEVDEAYSTQTCSCCKRRTGPKGLEGLRIREWPCLECGAYHHRDINSADNMLAAGRRRLAEGIPVLSPHRAAAAG